MKKLLLVMATICSFTHLNADFTAGQTFNYFQVWDYATQTLSNTLPISPDKKIQNFCIVIPDAQQPIFLQTGKSNIQKIFAGQDVKFMLGKQPLTIPGSFFSDGLPPANLNPQAVILILDWKDSGSTSELESQATAASAELKKLMEQINANYLLVGIGRGGLVANKIAQEEDLPRNVTLIFLGSPFIQDAKRYPIYATISGKNLNNAYVFYNDIPYRPAAASSLYPASVNLPKSYPDNVYLIRTIANNKEQSVTNITFLYLQDVLTTCAKVRTTYKTHRALWTSFSNLKPDANGLTGILKPATQKNGQAQQEQVYSGAQAKTYQENWDSTKILGANDGTTPIRSTYRLTNTK